MSAATACQLASSVSGSAQRCSRTKSVYSRLEGSSTLAWQSSSRAKQYSGDGGNIKNVFDRSSGFVFGGPAYSWQLLEQLREPFLNGLPH